MASPSLSARVKPSPGVRRWGWSLALSLGVLAVSAAGSLASPELAARLRSTLGLRAGTVPTAGGRAPRWNAPEFTFRDQHGSRVTKATFDGRVWIANFIFTRCQAACPLLTAKMRLVQRKLPHPELRFLSFSVDPAHDSAETLRRYAEGWAKDETRWHLLRTEPSSLLAVLDGMRVVIAPTTDPLNPIIHTSLFFLVDGEGRVRGQYNSHDERALAHLVEDTQALLRAASPAPSAVRDAKALASPTGKQHFDALGCAGCHEKRELAPPLAEIWGNDVTFADGTRRRVDAQYVRESLLTPGAKLVAGYANSMPSYAGELSEPELQDLVDYVRSLSAERAQASAKASRAPE